MSSGTGLDPVHWLSSLCWFHFQTGSPLEIANQLHQEPIPRARRIGGFWELLIQAWCLLELTRLFWAPTLSEVPEIMERSGSLRQWYLNLPEGLLKQLPDCWAPLQSTIQKNLEATIFSKTSRDAKTRFRSENYCSVGNCDKETQEGLCVLFLASIC